MNIGCEDRVRVTFNVMLKEKQSARCSREEQRADQ
jgi:hypothetical protein